VDCPSGHERNKEARFECRLRSNFIDAPFPNDFGPVGDTRKWWSWGFEIVIESFGHTADGRIDRILSLPRGDWGRRTGADAMHPVRIEQLRMIATRVIQSSHRARTLVLVRADEVIAGHDAICNGSQRNILGGMPNVGNPASAMAEGVQDAIGSIGLFWLCLVCTWAFQ
jgi:hypothetical protein